MLILITSTRVQCTTGGAHHHRRIPLPRVFHPRIARECRWVHPSKRYSVRTRSWLPCYRKGNDPRAYHAHLILELNSSRTLALVQTGTSAKYRVAGSPTQRSEHALRIQNKTQQNTMYIIIYIYHVSLIRCLTTGHRCKRKHGTNRRR